MVTNSIEVIIVDSFFIAYHSGLGRSVATERKLA